MQIGPLDLPDEVLTALEEQRLVIFAGAGVSMPAPASLPSFRGLVEGLIGRTLLRDEEGQMDRVLGRAKEDKVPVHRLAAERLARPDSRFNSLHENLLTLFGSAAAVRIVTTNFDLHFEEAIQAHTELAGIEIYTSPALPVGSSFTGLVHLHGALNRVAETLVLTDADFGRAYLTEGLLEELTPSAVKLAAHLEELGGERNYYGKFVAQAAFSLPDDPLDKVWFQAFLAKANDDDRMHFAWKLNEILKPLRPEQKTEIWRDWLKRYLEHRTQFPPPPKSKEFVGYVRWAVHLPQQLAELVDCLEALPGEGASTDRLFWRLQKDELAESDPNLIARLLLVVLKRCEKIAVWDLPQMHTVLKRLINEGAQEKLLLELIEKYMAHGGPSYQELIDLLRARDHEVI